jgi:hypothetical protein
LRDGRRAAISAGGGSHPRWSGDGRSIYYDAGLRLMRAAFDAEAGTARAAEVVQDGAAGRALAVTPGGRVLIGARTRGSDRAFVVVQWLPELQQRLPIPIRAPR